MLATGILLWFALTQLVRTVLCGRLSVILFYGLPHVKMATVLHTISRRCSTIDDNFSDRLHHILGIVSIWSV